ncbi:MAG: M48 family metallopeptidase [Paludibacter sp.]|nr:M48 family metallopeptidase [Paludibacter sp.]
MILSDLGEITFLTNKNIKNISVKILPEGLQVNLPVNKTQKEALEFIDRKRAVIFRRQEKLKQNIDSQLIVLPEKPLRTITFEVQPIASERSDVFFLLKNKVLTIEFPKDKDCTSKEMQRIFWNGINYFLRNEAKRILPVRLKQLADLYGFTYNRVTIKSTTGRWGSCATSKKNIIPKKYSINLSFYLLLTNAQLIDYVLLHELCHTREMNHSQHFWELMEKVTKGAYKELRTELKSYKMPKF